MGYIGRKFNQARRFAGKVLNGAASIGKKYLNSADQVGNVLGVLGNAAKMSADRTGYNFGKTIGALNNASNLSYDVRDTLREVRDVAPNFI